MQQDQFELHCDIEQRHWWFVARRQILGSVVRQLVPADHRPDRQATIIDVGCGTGERGDVSERLSQRRY